MLSSRTFTFLAALGVLALAHPSFAQKTISADTEFSKELMNESSVALEDLIKKELARAIGIGLDLGVAGGRAPRLEPVGLAHGGGAGRLLALA